MTARKFIMYAAALSMFAPSVFAEPVGTAFTYQGQLKLAGRPVDGPTDFRFSLWNDDVGGSRIGPILLFRGDPRFPPNVEVRNGLFAVDLDFGESAFDGQAIWLQIEVRHPDGDGPYTLITPRQNVTIVPYAVHALHTPNGHALDAADGTPTDVVFVAGDGKVGVGTTAPTSKLTIDSSGPTDVLRLLGPGANDSMARLHFGDGSNVYLGEDVNDSLTINSVGRTAITGGNVGIGTLSPSHKLTVVSATDDTLRLIGPDGGSDLGFGARLNFGDADYAYLDEDADDHLTIYARTGTAIVVGNVTDEITFGYRDLDNIFSETMRIQGNGNVGIGTTSPAVTLHVAGDRIRLQSSTKTLDLRADGGAVDIQSETHSIFIHSSGPGGNNHVLLNAFGGEGNVGIGTFAPAAKLDVNGTARVRVLTITGGSDLAEPFHIGSHEATEPRSHEGKGEPRTSGRADEGRMDDAIVKETHDEIRPGMVAVIDPHNPGKLRLSHQAYDRKVAGIISGANGLAPGMIMSDQGKPLADGNHPVALTGRVWCWCDAGNAAIEPGDLLTTSGRIGHAMKVTDYADAQGAILGKAMSPLSEGTGLVLVLVSLQ